MPGLPTAAVEPKRLPPDEAELRRDCDLRLQELRLERTGVEPQWREITRHILPQRGRYVVLQTTQRAKYWGQILDPAGTKSHLRLSSFCQAGITTPSAKWFRLGIAQDDLADDPDVKSYLGACEQILMRVFSSGNFYHAIGQIYQELAGYGTAPMLILRDYKDVARFYPLTAGEYFCALDDRQEINTIYREYTMRVSQVVEQFGFENCSLTTQNLYLSKRYSGPVVIVHAIEPNKRRKSGRLGWRGLPWVSAYYERYSTQQFLKLEGYSYKPFIAPRWEALAGDAYGTGPSHHALADIKSLQVLTRRYHELIAKLAEPPLQGDARWQQSYLGQLPGDVNWISGLDGNKEAGLRPIFQVPPQVQGLWEQIADLRKTISETYYNDLVLMLDQMEGVQPRNELEITERRQEKLLQLGPMLEGFHSEALAPLIQTVFSFLNEARVLPPQPDKLRGHEVQPQFVSVLAQAQKAVGTAGLEQLLRILGSMAPVWQDAAMKLNATEFVDEYADSLSISSKVIVPTDQVEQQKQMMARQQQAAQMAQAAPGLAQAAQTLSETDVGGGQNALQRMGGAI